LGKKVTGGRGLFYLLRGEWLRELSIRFSGPVVGKFAEGKMD
jgi:hypothetical protein